MPGAWSGQVVLVTGAASGIGRATATAFAEAGAELVLWDVDDELGVRAASELERVTPTSFRHVDIAEPGSVENAAAELERIDCLVAAAAIGGFGELASTSTGDWRRIMATDLDGTFWCLRECVPKMVNGGSVVLIASDRAFVAEPGWGPYSVAKAAVVQLGRAAAAELAEDDIRVNVVCPGPTDTPLLGQLKALPGVHEHVARKPLLRRLATPDEVARIVVTCAEHRFMTGSVVTVDGGASLVGPLGVQRAIGSIPTTP